MKRALLGLVLVCVGMAQACKNQVPEFKAKATDGKFYSKAGLANNPTIFVFLRGGEVESRRAIPRLNQLASSLKGTARVVGIIDAGISKAMSFSRTCEVGFALIADPKREIAKGFGVERGLQMTYTAPKTADAKFPKLWDGLTRTTVEEMLTGIQHHGVSVPEVDLAGYPR
jgi:peroxiredoxin